MTSFCRKLSQGSEGKFCSQSVELAEDSSLGILLVRSDPGVVVFFLCCCIEKVIGQAHGFLDSKATLAWLLESN